MLKILQLIARRVWPILRPILTQFATRLGAEVLEVAHNVVGEVARDPALLTNADRREAALKYIRADLQQRGYEIGRDVKESLINTAIEVAVQKLKAS